MRMNQYATPHPGENRGFDEDTASVLQSPRNCHIRYRTDAVTQAAKYTSAYAAKAAMVDHPPGMSSISSGSPARPNSMRYNAPRSIPMISRLTTIQISTTVNRARPAMGSAG